MEICELSHQSKAPLPCLLCPEQSGCPLHTSFGRGTSQFRLFPSQTLVSKNVIGKIPGSAPQGIKKCYLYNDCITAAVSRDSPSFPKPPLHAWLFFFFFLIPVSP